MIRASFIRLINWYGFSNNTFPIGLFTLIAGRNGNGKSVVLDAIKYALYGDTVFNKSSENKGSRTLSSYTRGLLDATAGTYIRPADKIANVYTHIVLEMHEVETDRYFILGTVIETNSANGVTTQRYVIEDKRLVEIENTYMMGEDLYIYSGTELQKKYGLKMMGANEGLAKFMHRTGLRLDERQLASFRRKLRSIMSYDPDAKIDQFIRENVLEEKKVDFSKLVEIKKNIDTLTETFRSIDAEIKELDSILVLFEELKRAKNNIFADDVKIAYKQFLRNKKTIDENNNDISVASKQKDEDEIKLKELEGRESKTRISLNEAKSNLEQMDCAKAIREAEDSLADALARKQKFLDEKKHLLELQNRISEICSFLVDEEKDISDKEVLSSLTEGSYSSAIKENSVDRFAEYIKEFRDELLGQIAKLESLANENGKHQAKYQQIIDECLAKKTTFSDIPDYVSLKNEINKAFKSRGIESEAHFACEYVIGLTDESWRNVIEGYLGRRRYTILVEPEYYDIADEVFNLSKNKYAHLFNTKLLMKKNICPEEDSVVRFVEIKNSVAKKYFDFQLGRFHATSIDCVKNFENAMSKEGRVSVAMDSFFVRVDAINHYYLGQEAIEVNRKMATKRLDELKRDYQVLQGDISEKKDKKEYLETELKLFESCNYDAWQNYDDAVTDCSKKEIELKNLKEAQKNNREYILLAQKVESLQKEYSDISKTVKDVKDDFFKQDSIIFNCKDQNRRIEDDLKKAQERLTEYEIQNSVIFGKAVADYDKYIKSGKAGAGGILKDRDRAERLLRETGKNLQKAQCSYNLTTSKDNPLPETEDSQADYQIRKERIWVDDRQEIQEKLKEQTQRYESIFKNEFVLTVLKSCEAARDDLKHINAELSRLDFKAVYEFDVRYVKDGSNYEKILEYAKYLKEREELGSLDGQMMLDGITSYSNDKGEELEEEIKNVIDKIVSSKDQEQIEHYADYRNYMNYEILVSNDNFLNKAKLSRQTGYNSGAEVQIPYMLILLSALLMIYNDKSNSTRMVFIDEPFAKMDAANIRIMLNFMKEQHLQMIFCAPDKTEVIGNQCDVILPVLRTRPDLMELGFIEMHDEVKA